jgi:hypothetical protein
VLTHTRASDDVQNAEKVRSLLKDLREARQAKSRDGLSQLDHSELSVCSSVASQRTHSNIFPVAEPVLDGD